MLVADKICLIKILTKLITKCKIGSKFDTSPINIVEPFGQECIHGWPCVMVIVCPTVSSSVF